MTAEHRGIWPARVMCAASGVSPSGFHTWRSRPESPRKIAHRELLSNIRRLRADHRGRYGAPRLHAELRARGHSVSRQRVTREMRQHGIRARLPRRYRVCTTDSKPSLPAPANLKTERVHQRDYPDRDAARRDRFADIEADYNRRRIHSAIGYITPQQAHRKTA